MHHRGVLTIDDDVLKILGARKGTNDLLNLCYTLLHEKSVNEQSLIIKRIIGISKKPVKHFSSEDEKKFFVSVISRLLLVENAGHDDTTHLYVSLCRILEAMYGQQVEEDLKRWLSLLSGDTGVRPWMQIASMISGNIENITSFILSQRKFVFEFFTVRCNALLPMLQNNKDDHQARVAGREVEAMMSCIRDLVPLMVREKMLDEETRSSLKNQCQACLFSCKWTHIHCSVGGMAFAILEEDDQRLRDVIWNEELDFGARLCLCRGIINSTSKSKLILESVWPFLKKSFKEQDLSSISTTHGHFLISALDALAKCCETTLKTEEGTEPFMQDLVLLLINHYETSFHGPLSSGFVCVLKLLSKRGADVNGIFQAIWNEGRSIMFAPLEHFIRCCGVQCLSSFSGDFAELIVGACGDVRLKPGAIKVFNAYVAMNGIGWEQQLIKAMLSSNKTLHLTVAQNLIPASFKELGAEEAVKKLVKEMESSNEDNSLLRLAIASHLNNQKREFLKLVVPSDDLVRSSLTVYNAWIRRYALETAVAMQSPSLVSTYISFLCKEHSQSHRSTASGALCRWWKTKVGASADIVDVENRMSYNLYPGSPAARQVTVSTWLATKKAFSEKSEDLQVILIEMLCSRYDYNRNVAAQVLQEHFRGKGVFKVEEERKKLLELSCSTLKSIRIRIADGGARLFNLLHEPSEAVPLALDMLQTHIKVGQQDFEKLAAQYSLHGPLLILKYILEERGASVFTKELTLRLLQGCRDAMALCSPFVCDNTIEGFSENVKLPVVVGQDDEESMEDDDDEDGPGSHVRVCAWRGVRESCLVLGSAMQHLMELMSERDIHETTDTLLSIVFKSKHRGALENASIGLEQTCVACLRSSRQEARVLPQKWLDRVLSFDAQSMGTVRRSAGIPYAICVILRSEKAVYNKRDTNTPLVSKAMKKLLDGVRSEDTVKGEFFAKGEKDTIYYRSQVHHLNILRHILRDSSLSDFLRPFLEELLLLSLTMWNHQEWSIRNSSSLLFASAMRKLDPSPGTDTADGKPELKLKKFEFKLFRSHFKDLMDHIAATLKKHADTKVAGDMYNDLFPVLLILKKLHVLEADEFSELLYGCCKRLSSHPNQMIRHAAAKSAAALTETGMMADRAKSCISEALDNVLERNTNAAHGLLCCALEMGFSRVDQDKTLDISVEDEASLPLLLSLRCPPLADKMLQVVRVWKMSIRPHVMEMIKEDFSVCTKEDYPFVPVYQSAKEDLKSFLDGVAKHEVLVVDDGDMDDESQSESIVRNAESFSRASKEDIGAMVAMLHSEEAQERKQACKAFVRLFPECGKSVLHPCHTMHLLFEKMQSQMDWSSDWFFDTITVMLDLEDLKDRLTMRTVFEKENNPLFEEPILCMQLCARELLRTSFVPTKEKVECFLDNCCALVEAILDTTKLHSKWDIHFWNDLFEPFFGAVCGMVVLRKRKWADGEKLDRLEVLMKGIDLPFLLQKGRDEGNVQWLIDGWD